MESVKAVWWRKTVVVTVTFVLTSQNLVDLAGRSNVVQRESVSQQ